MTNSRLEQLLTFENESPKDPFIKYALALEYLKDDVSKAGDYFELLLQKFPDYLPTYYHAGKYYEGQNKLEKAEFIYNKGLELAKLQNDNHAASELQTAIDWL